MKKNIINILRSIKIFDINSKEPFELTFEKFKTFLDCRHCFYLDAIKGVNIPQKNDSELEIFIKELLKKEFNYYRKNQLSHSVFKLIDFKGVPLNSASNNNLIKKSKGEFKFIDNENNFLLRSYIDDLWIDENKKKTLIVKYKIVSEKRILNEKILSDGVYKDLLIHLDFNNWLLRDSFDLCEYSYILFINTVDSDIFNKKLNFDYKLIKYFHKTNWIEKKLVEIKNFLLEQKKPEKLMTCYNCKFSHILNKF
jgi:hypothetical protein